MRVFASFNASTAKNTFGRIAGDGRADFIHRHFRLRTFVYVISCARNFCNVQKFAVAIFVALLTIFIVVGKEQFHRRTSCRRCFGGRNGNFHTFRYGIYARCNQTSRARCFYQANTARAFRAFAVIECAKGRDFKTAAFCRFENGHASLYFKRETFNFNIYFRHNSTYLTSSRLP